MKLLIVGMPALLCQRYIPDNGEREFWAKNKMIAGQTTIYVCRDKTCTLPAREVNKALEQIGK